jgi:lysophospholipase L1-like esterase
MEETAPPFEDDIRAFEAADAKQPPAPGGIVFVGSSSFTLWETMEQDLAPFPVVRRGFGGSQLSDSVRHCERIVLPYRPRAVVLYAGDNDLAEGKSPEQVAADFDAFVNKVHGALPDTKIAFLSIKPSPSRRHLFPEQRRANALVAARVAGDPRLSYIDIVPALLDERGEPRAELFGDDMLHLNRRGYLVWAEILRPRLALLAG